jgi:malonyl-CoA O-methyltransferase
MLSSFAIVSPFRQKDYMPSSTINKMTNITCDVILERMNIQNAYDEWSGSYDSDENLTRDLDQKLTREFLASRHFDSILEIGCGTGKNTGFLAQIGTNVLALDFSQGMIEKAREKVKAGNVRFALTDLTQRWDCEDDAHDLIVCCLVLEHIESLSHIFSEAERTLTPGGTFLINELHPFKQYNGAKARYARASQTVRVEAFVHHISDFIHAAEENGLKLNRFNEYWHEADQDKPPRIASFLFEK